jgi:putative ABC transport system permease protein
MSVMAGYAISALVLNTTKHLFTLANAFSVAEGMGFGIMICLACGLYPAWRAANLNPIDALRHE